MSRRLRLGDKRRGHLNGTGLIIDILRLCRSSRSRTFAIGRRIVVGSVTVICLRAATNRFRWNRTTTSIKSRGMSSEMRYERMPSHVQKIGGGQVLGVESMGRRRSDVGSATGHCRGHELGRIESTSLRQRRSWMRSGAASCVASRTEARTGSRPRQSNSGSSPRFDPAVARERTRPTLLDTWSRLIAQEVPYLVVRHATRPRQKITIGVELVKFLPKHQARPLKHVLSVLFVRQQS